MKTNPMIIVVVGLILIAIGTGVFWYGGVLKNKEDTAVLQQTIDTQTALIGNLREETERLRGMGDVQLQTTKYLQELNEEVKAVYVRIRLKERFSFESLCPLNLGIEFSSLERSRLAFKKLITDNEARKSDVRLESFKIYSISKTESLVAENEFIDTRKRAEVDELLIQILVNTKMKGTIRDFHGQHFMVFLPEQLLDKVLSVELIVNGWKLIQKKSEDIDWIPSAQKWLTLFNADFKMFQSRMKGFNERPTSVLIPEVYGELPEYEKNLSNTIYYGSLVDGLRMITR